LTGRDPGAMLSSGAAITPQAPRVVGPPAERGPAVSTTQPREQARFLSIEVASGLALLAATALALAWANSPWEASYRALWHTPLGLHLGGWRLERDLHFLINDGLMVVFFFVVGMEIRREIHAGELSQLRRAALPAFAALGGMIAPACIYLALNRGGEAAGGWGVPMATDIAFAVGILALLGRRVPPALRILLLALAVIDDLGAIVVIALFYSAGLDVGGLAVAGGGLLLVALLQRLRARAAALYLIPGLVMWVGIYRSGIHPTLAGVIMGLVTPARAPAGVPGAQAPIDRLVALLHPWVAFAIMPLFALANAGVALGGARLQGTGAWVTAGVVLGLALGKPLGVLGLCWAAVRLRLAVLPAGVGWPQLLVVGVVAGIGFTMALFIAALAFPAGALLEAAKLGILAGSLAAGLAGLAAGFVLLRPRARAAPPS
jgi:Na+:H+ antiporter, NhaA family